MVNWLSGNWKTFRKLNPVAEQIELRPSDNLPIEAIEQNVVKEDYILYDK
jgi:hypothetical protein